MPIILHSKIKKMITKRNDGKWLCDLQPGGRGGKRIKRIFKTQSEAKAFEIWAKAEHQQKPEWTPVKKDQRRLTDLCKTWFENHGKSLKDGANRQKKLLNICEKLGNPIASNFKPSDFADFRNKRIEEGASENTINHDHAYLKSVFSELIKTGEWAGDNPLKRVKPLKFDEREMSFLTDEQISELLLLLEQQKNIHVKLITKVCLSTGARWGEAEGLRLSQIVNHAIRFNQTKSGKIRTVPISADLEKELKEHYKTHGKAERLFEPSYNSFCNTVTQTSFTLPDGQATHVLRHTFASHFMMNGGNILTLQKLLGHSTLTMTMRYAHLAPDHLNEARDLNPISMRKK